MKINLFTIFQKQDTASEGNISNSRLSEPRTPNSELRTASILKKVRHLEIKTRGLTNHIFGGEYHSAFKGRGMSFSEVREYAYGDDVRNIDWNVTARTNTPFIKVFEEERELTLMLIVDISASSLFGTTHQTKRDLITEICAVLSFSAIKNNDKVGVIFFSDKIERYIPPKKGKSHILFIIRELLTMEPHHNAQTNITEALKFLNNVMKKRSIAFLLSDFISANYKDALHIAARRHDMIGIHVHDPRDKSLPNIGLIKIQDSETGKERWIDTDDKSFQKKYQQHFSSFEQQTKDFFTKCGSSLLSIRTDEDYVKKLQLFFKSRIR
ncbi:MAG: DUF58 domain-containing protein [Bacteroidetes bacterium]|nr:DUF58 domain-containing protein [Bacteroidota bacterium]